MCKILIALLFVISSLKGFSQWQFINPIPSNGAILAMTFLDTLTGFSAGDKGQIMKTTDGGITWRITNTDLTNSITLYNIKFYNRQIGYACGVYEGIYKTIDGGEHWSLVHYNLAGGASYGKLEEIYIYDSLTVYIGGAVGLFYATTNGGATWQKRQSAATAHTPRAMHFFSVDTGLYINSGVTGYIRKTNDGGFNWYNDTIAGIAPDAYFYDIKFLNRDTVFICGTGKILKSTDGGATWNITTVNSTHILHSIYFADNLHGYIYGYNINYKTADGGTNWTPIPIVGVTASGCVKNSFIDSLNIVTAIKANYIKKSTDGGNTWTVTSTDQIPMGTECNSVFFTDDLTGYLAGTYGKIYKTTDGAATWTQQVCPTLEILNSICFVNRDTGFIAADDGIFLRTYDAGVTWVDTYTGTKWWKDVMFTSTNIGYRVGTVGAAEKTIDGGNNWTTMPVGTTSDMASVHFINDTVGYIGGAIFKRTTDGGQTWTTITGTGVWGSYLWCMSADTVLTVGSNGTVTRTTDGSTFYQVADLGTNQLTSIYCTDSYHCYCADDRGNIYYSTDGGLSWVQQESPSMTPIHSFYFINKQKGFAFAEGNALLTTDNGGGKSEISGYNFIDANFNGVKDSAELPSPGFILSVNNGASTFTAGNSDSAGYYSFGVNPGNYTIQIAQPPAYYSITPSTNSASFPQAMDLDTANNFAFQPLSNVTDVRIELTAQTRLRKNTDVAVNITYANKGTQVADGTVQLIIDTNLVFVSSNPVATVNGDTLTWNYTNLNLFETRAINLIVHLPSTVPSITPLQSVIAITTSVNDSVPADNFDVLNQSIMAPLDPNSKEAEPENYFTTIQVTNGDYLTYTIHFQNIGNDTAFNISIVDTLSSNLNIGSFEILASSYPVTWNLSAPSIINFHFNNIQLPDSTTNEPASHGFVKYRIKPLNTLQVNDNISNTAAIYFDFEPAIITNTVPHTIVTPVGVASTPATDKDFILVIPNPFRSATRIVFNNPANHPAKISLYDVAGRMLNNTTVQGNEYYLQGKNLFPGVYFVEVITESKKLNCKVLVY